MRAKRMLRMPAAAQIGAATLLLAVPTAAAAAVVSSTNAAAGSPSGGSALASAVKNAVTAVSASATTRRRQHRAPLIHARLAVPSQILVGVAGQPVSLAGRLLPVSAGRVIRLLTRTHDRWVQIAWTRTGRGGGFTFRYRAPYSGSQPLRVSVNRTSRTRAASASAGTLVSLHRAVASWYDDAGGTACGFHAFYGVANKTLPCGTNVTISYGGRTVIATVDDRGPFVRGRAYDLNQNTQAALGMDGVQTVLASV